MNLKICAGASAGGHLNQLLKVLNYSEDWITQPSVYITTQPELAGKLEKRGRTYIIGECNRYHPLAAINIIFKGFVLMLKEKPDVIITTGSMPIAMICLVAKLFRKKIIWIDSIANTERFSLSGRLMYHFADLFLTQWPHLAKTHRKAEYVGAIL